ncbi:uncharacterized protein ATNIH1004_010964 [Aspergillus tanneri]|uniref:Uncharacterized protein n=1 Tax=Aspergillus tanneri TaxID=1220188 RepID=A0A5M9M9N9_9EURO|nr:uncharacterized protein ATNIH1004_010964 [Aspergillus tanneri]KAA8642024.1 hypothetical protein ATNIH1004_010964 [Aspergillus tanneri]
MLALVYTSRKDMVWYRTTVFHPVNPCKNSSSALVPAIKYKYEKPALKLFDFNRRLERGKEVFYAISTQRTEEASATMAALPGNHAV